MNERRKRSRYDGRIAANLPERPLRLSSSGLITVASAINQLAVSIRHVARSYDQAAATDQEYAASKITRGIKHISDLWEALLVVKDDAD